MQRCNVVNLALRQGALGFELVPHARVQAAQRRRGNTVAQLVNVHSV